MSSWHSPRFAKCSRTALTGQTAGNELVRRKHAERDSSHHDRKSDAMDAARETGRPERVEVVAHGRDGKIPIRAGAAARNMKHDFHPSADCPPGLGILSCRAGWRSRIRIFVNSERCLVAIRHSN
ncbi:MAG: DUF2188 domain-containing protein [Acidobacteria bacterium]|nr:DUF2188 domain-containing protein [Acidobacteriota bacterium]